MYTYAWHMITGKIMTKKYLKERKKWKLTKAIALAIAIIAGLLLVCPKKFVNGDILLTISAIALIVAGRMGTKLSNFTEDSEDDAEE